MFSSYTTLKFIRVENWAIACVYNILMLVLFGYVVGISILWNKGYQKIDHPLGTTSAKVKGTAKLNLVNKTDPVFFNSDDFVYPASENDALFVTTKYLFTTQTQDSCEGNKGIGTCEKGCEEHSGKLHWSGAGQITGECPDGYTFCEVMGWCPLEDDREDAAHVIGNVENWTVFFKVNIEFNEFGVGKTNALAKDGKKPVKGYNLFSIQEIVEMSGSNWTEALDTGAIILFTTKFSCNLDKAHGEQCDPEYKASRIDNVAGTISPGFNFRTTTYNGEMEERILMKRWGIRIIFALDGHAGKFDIWATLLTFGAGIGFFSIATVVCDYLLSLWQDDKGLYDKEKYQEDPYNLIPGENYQAVM